MLIGVLKKLAPALAQAAMGPAGVIAPMAIKAIAEKLGVEPDETAVEQHLLTHPEDAVKLEQIDADKLALQLQEMKSARGMQEGAILSADPVVRRFVYLFIAFWSLWSAIMLPFMVFGNIPTDNVRFADTILGFMLATMIGSMFGFLLGSSLGSKDKDRK